MPKTKYKYNPQTLTYDEVNLSLFTKIIKVALYLAPGVLIGFFIAFLSFDEISSPNDKKVKSELKYDRENIERINEEIRLIDNALNDISKRDADLYRTSLYTDKLPDELVYKGIFEAENYAKIKVSNEVLIKELDKKLRLLNKKIKRQAISFKELAKLTLKKELLLASMPAIQPVSNRELKELASGFGFRIDPIYKTRKMHTGLDFTSNIGAEVYATGDGVVSVTEVEAWGYGKSIVINHGFGFKTRYAHLNGFAVRKGQKVKRGQLIGYVGNTGKSTGPHLHYEVEKGGVKVNPIQYCHSDLSPEQYEKLIETSQNSFKAFD